MAMRLGLIIAACAALLGCAKLKNVHQLTSLATSGSQVVMLTEDNVLDGIADLDFCSQGDSDKVSLTFCVPNPPKITSLAELRAALGLDFKNPAGGNGVGQNPGFALTGHSSSLVSRYVSAINPRAIVFTPGVKAPTDPYVVMGYTRGEPFAEIAAIDAVSGDLNFYLVQFRKPCHETGTCAPGDLLTPAVESGWSKVTFYESDTFKNTIMDCLQCHQRGGNSPILRMQEIAAPYTHFFSSQTTGGQALLADFHAAHGAAEDYAAIPAGLIDKSDPALMAAFVTAAGFGTQPNAFASAVIEAEVKASSPAQPASNDTPGTSATWLTLFDQFVQGLAIPPPYHDVKVTSSAKLATMTQAYKNVMSGAIAATDLPDIRDVFLDSPQALSEMGMRVKPGLDAKGILLNACTQCHNGVLDQKLSRAHFNPALVDSMSRGYKDYIINRIQQPSASLKLMPPRRFRTLTEAEKQIVIDYLRQ